MHIKQRYWVMAAILFILLSIGVGGWAWSSILSLQHSTQPVKHRTVRITPTPDLTEIDVASGSRLIIPAIGVNAPIESVGQTAEGYMDVPTHNRWTTVGWYKGGPNPGHIGSAVIDGHLDRDGGAPAVFWNLHKLHVNDMVSVQGKTGHTLHFKVTKVANYAHATAPAAQIFNNKDGVFLNLVTCSGVWVTEENQRSQRLVIYTKLVA
jgi:sortase (surface protein transpeptidase)